MEREEPEPASVVGDVGSNDEEVPVSPTSPLNWPYALLGPGMPPIPPLPPSDIDDSVGERGGC